MGRIAVRKATAAGARTGAAVGRVAGAALGSIVPVVGTAIGGALGGLAGGAIGGAGGAAVDAGKFAAGKVAGAKALGVKGAARKVGQAAKNNPLQTAGLVQGAQASHAANAEAKKQASMQQTQEAAQRGREISTGTAKSDDKPMYDAWKLLKARMEVGPHDEQQDELFEHLKNINSGHSIRTNEEDNSFILDNIHDQDEDVARRLIQSYDRNFVDGPSIETTPESNYF